MFYTTNLIHSFTFLYFGISLVFSNVNNTSWIITREQWGAKLPQGPVDNVDINPPPFVVIHHSVTKECNTENDCKTIVRSIQNYHMKEKNWSDIGYNFLIGGDENVYEGRGWGKRGAHTKPYNAKSIGICLIGNFQNTNPSESMIKITKKLINYGVQQNNIASNYSIIGHRQAANTLCPGQNLFDQIKTWIHFSQHPQK